MMRELADNVLDIAQNSVAAGASLLELTITVDEAADLITLIFSDNGCGMTPEFAQKVTDPFTTTRKTRKVGLGLPFLKMTAQTTGGDFSLESQVGVGTTVKASFGLKNIDRPPMGDLAGTLQTLVILNTHMDFLITYRGPKDEFVFDTRQIKPMVEPLELNHPDIAAWISDYIKEGMNECGTVE
ncbi:MAG: sensor histidine kinase [Clostridia bacterium]|nr:sensor histidine kinase [Clostridia bacterium]